MITITGLGGCNEVGREAILLDMGQERFLLDYGVNVQTMASPSEPELPLTALILTHAHLDHSGHIPCLYKRGFTGPLIATSLTLDLAELLLTDSIKVQRKKGLTPHYMQENIEQGLNFSKIANFGQIFKFKTATVQLRCAGHIPGAASILIEGKKKILYTGDINFIDTLLVGRADTNFKDIDVLISESTYSYKNHPERNKLAENLKDFIQNIVYNRGFVILPCFAVGRTQEMLTILANLGLPLYLDGMGIEATARMLNWPIFLKNVAKLREAFSAAQKIRKPKQRKEVLSKPGIIIASAGMCLHPDTYVQQSDGSCVKIKDVDSAVFSSNSGHILPFDVKTKFIKHSPKRLVKFKTSITSITCTHDHKFLILKDLEPYWQRAQDIGVGDHIAYVWAIPFRGRTQKIKFDIKCRTDATKIRLPCKTDKDFCQFLGYFVGDGDIKGNRLVRITDKDRSNLEFYQALAKKVFGIEGKIKFDGRQRLIFCSAMLAKFLRNFGIQKSAQRTIPAIIQRTSKKQLASFLRGLFDAEGCVVISTNRGILLASASQDMAQVVQLLLLRFGIHSEIREVWRTVQGKRYKIYHLRIHSPASLRLFAKNISFDSRPKLEKLNSLLNTIGKGWSHLELIPIKKATLYNEIKRELKKVPQIFKTKFDLFATNKKGISRKQFERLIKELENYNLTELVAKLKMVKNYLWIKVLKKITIKSDTQYVYDIEIPGPSNYVANGFIVHNCQGGPVQSYIRWLYNREDCAMILNGYQIAGTPGRILLDTGRLVFGDLDIKPKMTVKFMDFSAHCGRDDLIDFYKKVNPGKIVLVHGDQTEAFAQELREMGFDAIAPRNGERIKI